MEVRSNVSREIKCLTNVMWGMCAPQERKLDQTKYNIWNKSRVNSVWVQQQQPLTITNPPTHFKHLITVVELNRQTSSVWDCEMDPSKHSFVCVRPLQGSVCSWHNKGNLCLTSRPIPGPLWGCQGSTGTLFTYLRLDRLKEKDKNTEYTHMFGPYPFNQYFVRRVWFLKIFSTTGSD